MEEKIWKVACFIPALKIIHMQIGKKWKVASISLKGATSLFFVVRIVVASSKSCGDTEGNAGGERHS